MNMSIAAPIAVRKGFNYVVNRADGWYLEGDVLNVVNVESRQSAGEHARLTLIRDGSIMGEALHSVSAVTANVIIGKWDAVETVHYLADCATLRVLNQSNGDFEPAAICGHGAPASRLKTSVNQMTVTCPRCLRRLADYHKRK